VNVGSESFPGLLSERAEATPDAVYLQNAKDGSTITFAEADRCARTWAYALRGHGVERGHTVLTMLQPGLDAIAAWLGTAWLGAIEVPINTAYRGRMLRYIVDDSDARTLVVHADYFPTVVESLGDELSFDAVVIVGDDSSTAALPTTAKNVLRAASFLAGATESLLDPPRQHDIASILYTSGTTGASKGVLVPWRQALLTATGILPTELFGPEDVYYSPFPMYHMSGKAPLIAMALLGGRVVLRERFSTDMFWSDVRTYGVTSTNLVGAMANFLVSQPEAVGRNTTLRDVLMLPLPADTAAFEKRFGVRCRTTFNMTETACCILSEGYNLPNETSCGKVRPGFEARVVDAFDEELAPGELGELVLRADTPWTLMAGYWKKPEATAATWRNQWLHTGDGFTRDADGNFYFVDRLKDAIRRRGENVSSFEVEAEINEHTAVLESAVIAVPSEQSEDEIKAVVVLKPGRPLSAEELGAFLEQRMASFMVPRFIEFVDELPKTPTSKIRKAELRERGITPQTYDRGDSRARRQVGEVAKGA
jgi:carnitine-CoA ligase